MTLGLLKDYGKCIVMSWKLIEFADEDMSEET